jgi:Protein of unknown function (DUF3800)
MELIFADDSGKDRTRAAYFIEAAVAFNEIFLHSLEAHLSNLKQVYGIPPECELHWQTRTYRHREGNVVRAERRLTAEEHEALRMSVLSFLPASAATVIAVALAHQEYRNSLAFNVSLALEWIAERAQMHLQGLWHLRKQRVLGLLIADEPGSPSANREVTSRLQRLHREGSLFISRFDNLVMNSLLYPSHLVSGIQLADFVAGAIDRFLNRREERWWYPLQLHLRRNIDDANLVLGYGLVVRPDVRPIVIGNVTIN